MMDINKIMQKMGGPRPARRNRLHRLWFNQYSPENSWCHSNFDYILWMLPCFMTVCLTAHFCTQELRWLWQQSTRLQKYDTNMTSIAMHTVTYGRLKKKSAELQH